MTPSTPVDVFISRKSSDAALSKQLYQFLTAKGLTVFESDETLPRLGNADYRKAIDQALDQCRHLIVVGSNVENIQSSWVEAEWGTFINEKRAGRKPGNLLSVITDNIKIAQLPTSLRNLEVIYFDHQNFERIYAYVGAEGYTPPKPPLRLPTRWLLPGLVIMLIIGIAVGYTYLHNQPFDLTVFAKPATTLQLKPDYPAFQGGELAIYFNNKEEKKQTLSNGEVVLKQLPASLLGQKIPVKLLANHWKSETDSIVIEKTIELSLVPDGSLGLITGNVMTKETKPIPIDKASVRVDSDTTLMTNAQGVFTAHLPYRMQKDHYRLTVQKDGFEAYRFNYYPKSTPPDVRLTSKK